VIFRARRTGHDSLEQLFTISVEGGEPKLVQIGRAGIASFSADGNKVAFIRNTWFSNWRRYKGGTAPQIWTGELTTGKFEQMMLRFRTAIVPLAHDRQVIDRLLAGGTRAARQAFLDARLNTPMRRSLATPFPPRRVPAREADLAALGGTRRPAGGQGALRPERGSRAAPDSAHTLFMCCAPIIPGGSAAVARSRARTPGRCRATPASCGRRGAPWYGRARRKPRRSRAGSAG